MYKILILAGAFGFIGNGALADAVSATGAPDEMTVQRILEPHSLNCGSGESGSWLKLDSGVNWDQVSGGMSSINGQYFGCGSCDDCRNSLNQKIERILGFERQHCASRGGKIVSEDRGTLTESVQPGNWTMTVKGVTADCQKWVPCN
jgi:hypothetical protein